MSGLYENTMYAKETDDRALANTSRGKPVRHWGARSVRRRGTLAAAACAVAGLVTAARRTASACHLAATVLTPHALSMTSRISLRYGVCSSLSQETHDLIHEALGVEVHRDMLLALENDDMAIWQGCVDRLGLPSHVWRTVTTQQKQRWNLH